uniref:NADH-ubiquinone oxidoreductase chain 5 n=1 Tax=Osbornellus sp. EMHAU-2015-Zz052506 TaxID=2036856 RepID=A0A343K1B9_9HEMI|nr:NADH dehydrogenase subunit 5 [Osbornellus sp. EMHAU-2015-Zz052506]
MMFLNFYYIWSMIFFFTSTIFMIVGLNFLMNSNSCLLEWVLYSDNSLMMNFIIYLDWISMMFMFVVLFVSSMVVLYSSVYMGDYNYSSVRFLLLVLMFVFSMLLMILSPNLVSIMLGWDGLGLVSYCLVIYYSSLSSYLSGMLTCLINRLGDIGLLISISWLFSYGSWNFIFYSDYYNELIFNLIIISSFTKSAQIPFSAWLPAAMAAPTPVSSLVHSSTLVTAGVYLLVRFFNYLIFLNEFFLYLSIMTMIMSSICANYEFDLKSIIALSTLSQLGLMMSCLFMGLVDLSYFHLLSHAMFKSLLFLCSGIIIHLMGGCQDIRMMGSICMIMPLTCCCFNISNMSLCGFPFLSGFYSKDLIVESSSFTGLNLVTFILFYLGLGLTASYSIRLFYYSVLSNFNYNVYMNLIENISFMKYSISFLSLFSVIFGCLFIWVTNMDLSFLIFPFYLKILTLLMVFTGIYLGYEISFMKNLMSMNFYLLNGSMWFMYSYSYYVYMFNYNYSFKMNSGMFWGEFFGGLGMSYYFLKMSNYIQFYSLSSLSIFFLMVLLWVLFLL